MFVYEQVAGEDLPPVTPKTPGPAPPPRPPALSRGDGPSSEHTDSHQADAIRRFVIENLDSLATRGRLSIRVADVERGLGLSNRLPDIGSVLGGRKLQEEAGLRLVGRTGPTQSPTTEFLYEPVAGEDSPPAAPKTPVPSLPPQPATRPCGAASSSEHSESHGPVLCLVSCVSRKRLSPAPAKALYISDWFIKSRQVVKMEGWRWFILSAKYGLVDPDRQIEPYEKTLNNMSTVERRSWSSEVWKALERHLDGVRTVVFLAGQKYREDLEWRLRGRGIEVRVPMEGLRIGEQLACLNRRLMRSTPYGAEKLDPRPRGGGVEVQAQPEAPRIGERRARPRRQSTRPATPGTDPRRLADTVRFYELLGRIEQRVGGRRRLADCDGSMDWPERGVYFFFEEGEERSGSGTGDRVVRVGTHALKSGSKATLWGRLSQHRGTADGSGGNHRGSIFRLLVGVSLAHRGDCPLPPSWGVCSDLGAAARRLDLTPEVVKDGEAELECRVSAVIGAMPFLWLSVPDAPGRESARGRIERGAIALLSNAVPGAADPPSAHWLGAYSDRSLVRASGLWNNNHVEDVYDPAFLDEMEALIEVWN